jgi:hypothetical protein
VNLRNAIALTGRPTVTYAKLSLALGGLNECAFLCQFIYWSERTNNPDGWIYKTSDEIRDEIGISYKSQLTARKKLKALGLIEERHRWLDHQIDYRVMDDAVQKYLEGIERVQNSQGEFSRMPNGNSPEVPSGILQTSQREFSTLPDGNSLYKEHRVLTEITSENTNKHSPVLVEIPGSTKSSIESLQKQWFDEFWRYYPRKDDKTPCWERFKVHIQTQERFDKTMEALSLVLPEWATKEKQFIPYPKSWLGKKPWNDVESIRASRGSVAIAQPQQANTARPSMQERTHAAFVRQIQRMQEIQNGQMG